MKLNTTYDPPWWWKQPVWRWKRRRTLIRWRRLGFTKYQRLVEAIGECQGVHNNRLKQVPIWVFVRRTRVRGTLTLSKPVLTEQAIDEVIF